MTYNELVKFFRHYEDKYLDMDENTARKVVMDYLYGYGNLSLVFEEPRTNIEELYFMYFRLRNFHSEKSLEKIMQGYGYTYDNAIHEAIYNLLIREEDISAYCKLDPGLFPGIKRISRKIDGGCHKYTLDTKKGRVEVYQATEVFCDSKSSHIFKKDLIGNCYDRSLDFIKENKDFNVIISYLRNHFVKGHFHAYLERDEEILDIAGNAYYIAHEFSDRVLNGIKLLKLSYEEIEEFHEKVKDTKIEVPELSLMMATKISEDPELQKKLINDSI